MESKKNMFEYNSMCADLKGFIATNVDTAGLSQKLSDMGQEGWELDKTLFTQDGGSTVSAVIILKREQESVKKFEYSVVGIDLDGFATRKKVDNIEFNKTLNNMAQKGWELGETISTQAFGVTRTMFAIFKRKLV
ncbi:MAG: DUF4177 domain-containing protein [Nitrososphaerota archaeon]|jgi:hypothetical protein|nr:DUF4177 domain-containing protein [Nitrososphaerota archaeon]